VWVMQTLAHHTCATGRWVHLLNGLSGMLSYVTLAQVAVLDQTAGAKQLEEAPIVQILLQLISVYTSLDACIGAGHVKMQLSHHYAKPVKVALKKEFAANLDTMLSNVVEQVMTIASHASALRGGAVSPIERVFLKKLPDAVKTGHGAMSFRMANYEERAMPTTNKVAFMRLSANGLAPGPDGAAPRVTITLYGGESTLSTLSGSTLPQGCTLDLTCPVWVNEHITIEVFAGLPNPLRAQAAVLCGYDAEEVELGIVEFEMARPRGHLQAALHTREGTETGAKIDLCWEVGPWLTTGTDGSTATGAPETPR